VVVVVRVVVVRVVVVRVVVVQVVVVRVVVADSHCLVTQQQNHQKSIHVRNKL
jgi:hypothetical protein